MVDDIARHVADHRSRSQLILLRLRQVIVGEVDPIKMTVGFIGACVALEGPAALVRIRGVFAEVALGGVPPAGAREVSAGAGGWRAA